MTVSTTCCCGCCSLRTGTTVIAILCILNSTLPIFMGITALSRAGASGPDSDPWIGELAGEHGGGFMKGAKTPVSVFVLCLLLGLVEFALSALLCVGTLQSNPRLCSPWLCYNIFLTVLAVFSLTVFGIIQGSETNYRDLTASVYFMAGVAIGTVVWVYLLNVVNRFIKKLRWGGPPIAVMKHDDGDAS